MRILAPRAAFSAALLVPLLAVCAATSMLPSFLPAAASATDFYVDLKHGSDSNPGSADKPWRTIQKAADTMQAGHTVTVRAGDYGERVQVHVSGASGAPITYRAEGAVILRGFSVRADYITIQGFEITDTPDEWDNGLGIFVQGSYCIIENNNVHDATRGGIRIYAEGGAENGPTGCIVRNNRLHRNALSGVEINGSNHVVEDNEITGTIQYHPKWANPPGWADADGIRFFGSGHRIQRNYIHDISFDDPENANPHIDCFQTWGPALDIVLENNVCDELEYQGPHERGQGFMIEEKDGPVRNLTLRHNTVRAYTHVIVIHGENIAILNNVFTGDLSLPRAAQGSVELFDSRSPVVQNNRFCDVHNAIYTEGASSDGLTASDNAVVSGNCPLADSVPTGREVPDSGPASVDRPASDPEAQAFRDVASSEPQVEAKAPRNGRLDEGRVEGGPRHLPL